MKAAYALILLAVWTTASLPPSAAGAPRYAAPAGLFGNKYVRLADWSQANNFQIAWLRHEQLLQLTNRTARLEFEVDSREAEVNGVNVWLSHPIALNNGSPYIAVMDLKTVVKPVLNPSGNRPGARIRTIVLDPGHGGKDPGNQDGWHQEKRYTLLLAQELSDQLRAAGFKVFLTRTTDTLIDLPTRPEIARRRGADLFISLHWNSTGTARNEVKGVETYCLTPPGASSTNAGGEIIGAGGKEGNLNDNQNMFLAYCLQRALRNYLAVEDRGVRRARFAVLRTATMPAVLIEGGFMSNPVESKKIYDPAYRRQMARAIVNGILAYQTRVEQPR